MDFSAQHTFYHYNEQWVWFGWSDDHGGDVNTSPAHPLAVENQDNLKLWHYGGTTNPELLTPYYNLGFNAVQPYSDSLVAAKVDDQGYKRYGDYNAKNYLRRFTLSVKSLNFAQWEHDPSKEKDVHNLSDDRRDNTVGQWSRYITNDEKSLLEDEFLGKGTRETTLLDLNTQDLYYKEGEGFISSDGACIDKWDNPDKKVWDPWPQQNRTYGFGQYGGQEVGTCEFGEVYKRYASPVRGAPARIRRIPIYQKSIEYPSGASANLEGEHIAQDQNTSDYPLWVSDKCGNISIPEESKLYYSDLYGVDFNEFVLNKIIESAGGYKMCGGCDEELPVVKYKTGYYYTLSTAPVMAPGTTGTPSENGLGWDPAPGMLGSWAPSGGYGFVVENLTDGCASCIPAIQDVRPITYAGNTTSQGAGPCKVLELDMGLYEIRGNNEAGNTLYVSGAGGYNPVADTVQSNLWIGSKSTGDACQFFKNGLRSGDCDVIATAAALLDPDGNQYWQHEKTLDELMATYARVQSGYDAACELQRQGEYFETDGSKAIEVDEDFGRVTLNLRDIRGTGCIGVFKGEDIFSGDCEARNYLYISGACPTGGGSEINISGSGCANVYRTGDTFYISVDCPKVQTGIVSTGNLSGVNNITGTGCTTTYQIGDTIYVSGDCTTDVYVTGTGCATTFRQDIGGQEYIFVSAECNNIVTGIGCATTWQVGNTIYVSGHCQTGVTGNLDGVQSITGTGCTTTHRIGDTIYISGDCSTDVYVTGTGCATTFRQNIGGQEYIFVSGHCQTGVTGNLDGVQSITGTGCTTTYQIGDTIYISGDCTTDVYITGTGCATTFRQNIDGQEYIFVSGHCQTGVTGNLDGVQSITGTGCTTTYQIGDTIYISGDCTTDVYITGTGCTTTFRQNIGGQEYIFVSGECSTGNLYRVQNITGVDCATTYQIGDTIYISADCPTGGIVSTGNLSGVSSITGSGCINTYSEGGTVYISTHLKNLSGNFGAISETGSDLSSVNSNLVDNYYSITGADGSSCDNFLELNSITGSGCINTHQEGGYIYISNSLHKSTGNWPNVNFVNEESDIPNYNPSNLISGVYNYSSENECGFDYVALRSISGLCAFSLTTHENSILLGGNVTHYSANFKSNGAHLTGAVSSSDAIYDEISGTNLINQTYYVDQTVGGPANPIWVSQGEPYYHAGQVWSVADDCYMVIDAAWVNANTYTAPDADVADPTGPYGWKRVDCPCDLNTFTEFKSITGSGLISVSDEIINNTPYLNISAPLLIGTGCIETFEQDNTIYISGQDCFPEGGSSCDVLIGPGDSPSWKDTEDLILECLGLSWKKITMCEDDGSTACYEILARQVPCTTTATPTTTQGPTTTTSSDPVTTSTTLEPSTTTSTTPEGEGEVEYNYSSWQKYENMGITYGGMTWLEGLGPTGYHYDQSTYGRRGTDFVYNCSSSSCPKTGADFRIDYADFLCPEAAELDMWTFYANNGPQAGSYWNTDAEIFRSINTYEKLFAQYSTAYNNVSFITADPASKGGNFTGFTGEGIGFKFEDISNVDPNDGNAYTYNGHGFYLGIGTGVPPGHTLHQWTGEELLSTNFPHTGYNWYIKSGPGARQMWIRAFTYSEQLALEDYSSDDQGFVSVTTVDPCSHLATTTTIIPTSTTSAP